MSAPVRVAYANQFGADGASIVKVRGLSLVQKEKEETRSSPIGF
jgi:hypothetical protein